MSNLQIYIVEDEELYASQLEMVIDKLGYDLVGICDNSDTAKEEIEKLHPDLLLVDVKVNGSMNGIDLVQSLQVDIPVIFITSFDDEKTFNRAKDTKPYAYIIKPFETTHLQRTIELAFNTTVKHSNDEWKKDIAFNECLFIKVRNKLEKIQIIDILYLVVEDRYSTVYTKNGRKYVLRMSLGDVQEKLPDSQFMRIHRKYTINLKEVKTIDVQDNLIYIQETELPISRSHKEELLNKLEWLQ